MNSLRYCQEKFRSIIEMTLSCIAFKILSGVGGIQDFY